MNLSPQHYRQAAERNQAAFNGSEAAEVGADPNYRCMMGIYAEDLIELLDGGVTGPCPGWFVSAEDIARSFHGIYEHLAPLFGYTTRPESAVAWEDVPEANRRLMVQTCRHVLQQWFPAHVGHWLVGGVS